VARKVTILVQTTIPRRADDWSTESLTLMRSELAAREEDGFRFEVVARDRAADPTTPDPVLSRLESSDFDELWLFALDGGDGLTGADCSGITRFRERGGGILTTRDHQDMGSSLCTVGGVGAAHHFQTKNPEPERERRTPDDRETRSISWPNYHSGNNGDYQKITIVEPPHELLQSPDSPSGRVEFFPAHPHEGAVAGPRGDGSARVIAQGRSQTTGRDFNLVVTFDRSVDERGKRLGRAVAESSFSPLRGLQLGSGAWLSALRDRTRWRRAKEEPTGSRRYPALCEKSRAVAGAPELRTTAGNPGRQQTSTSSERRATSEGTFVRHTNIDVQRKARLLEAGRLAVENGRLLEQDRRGALLCAPEGGQVQAHHVCCAVAESRGENPPVL
jgi:hypothetical protein